MKVADTNHLDMLSCLLQSPCQVCDKPVCVSVIEFSLLQCTRKVSDKVRGKVCGLYLGHKSRKSATQIMKVGNMISVTETFMICVCSKVRDNSRTLSQSWRNGIWALSRFTQSMLSSENKHL